MWSTPLFVSVGNRIYNIEELLIRCFNIIVANLMRKPRVTSVYCTMEVNEIDGNKCYDATQWARGFSKAVKWRWKDWLPLINSPRGDELLGAITLLGVNGCHKDQEELTRTVAMRSALTTQIYYDFYSLCDFWQEKNAK